MQQSHGPDLLMDLSACIFAGRFKGHAHAVDADYRCGMNILLWNDKQHE